MQSSFSPCKSVVICLRDYHYIKIKFYYFQNACNQISATVIRIQQNLSSYLKISKLWIVHISPNNLIIFQIVFQITSIKFFFVHEC